MDIGKFNPTEAVAIDTETSGIMHWHGDKPFAVGLCDQDGNTAYVEWGVDPYTREPEVVEEDIEWLRALCARSDLPKIFHNAKFDCFMLETLGIPMAGPIHDTHIEARVAYNLEYTYQLKPLARKYLGIPIDDESTLREEVKKWRRHCQSLNRQAAKTNSPLIKLGEVAEQDYWLPKCFNLDSEGCEQYCRMDTFRTMGLHLYYQEKFANDPLLAAGYEAERELWPIMVKLERRGMRLSPEKVKEELAKARTALNKHHQSMLRMIEEKGLRPHSPEAYATVVSLEDLVFNPNSPLQLRRLLYNPPEQGGLGLTTTRTSDSGEYSTDKNALRELMTEPFVLELVGYRAAEQAIKLFFDKYLELMLPDPLAPGGMCVHPSVNQCGTTTFRLSCNNPNLQQVGNPKTAHANIGSYRPRIPFGPRAGHVWYAGDYAQQELRLFASIGQIPFLLQEISAGRDPNSACANKAWGGRNNPSALKAASYALDLGRNEPSSPEVAALWQEYEWNSKAAMTYGFYSQRSQELADHFLARHNYDIVKAEKSVGKSNSRGRAKVIMFAMIYGGGPSTITELLYCSLQEATQFLRELSGALPEMRQYMDMLIKQASRDGYIVNPYGRKVHIEEDKPYKAVNYMIQSTAACMVKDSMVRCEKYFKEVGARAYVVMPVHDEIIFEVHQEDAYRWLVRGMIDIMSDNEGRIDVPMPVEFKRCVSSWDDKVAIDV